jgi:hypothetical protein
MMFKILESRSEHLLHIVTLIIAANLLLSVKFYTKYCYPHPNIMHLIFYLQFELLFCNEYGPGDRCIYM